MGRITNIELMSRPETPMLSVRSFINIDNIPVFLAESMASIEKLIKEEGTWMTEVPFVAIHSYRTMNPDNTEVEAGYAVSRPCKGNAAVKYGILPESRVVTCFYQGFNEDMEPVYEELDKWIDKHSLEPEGTAYEYYYSHPDMGDQMLTRIVLPLK